MQCFLGDFTEIKASIKTMAVPLYLFCLMLMQTYAMGYGIWFLTSAGPKFGKMQTDCSDLVQFFLH